MTVSETNFETESVQRPKGEKCREKPALLTLGAVALRENFLRAD